MGLLFGVLVLVSGCGGNNISLERPTTGNIVFLGDSITRGYEVETTERYTALIESQLDAAGFTNYTVVNQGVDGDKTSDALERLEAVLSVEPEIVVLALGGNDFLRSRPLVETQANLNRIIENLVAENIEVILVGVSAPPLRGLSYSSNAKKMYQAVADEHDLVFMPNILKGMMLDQRYMQRDNIHPKVEGHQKIAENMWSYLEPSLRP